MLTHFVEQTWKARRLLVLLVAIPAGGACADSPPRAEPAAQAPTPAEHPTDTVRVQLVDHASGQPLADAEVEVYADNGVRCVTTPCPTNGRSWRGRSNGDGIVAIPKSAIDQVTHVGTSTHGMVALDKARKDGSGLLVLELTRH